MTEPYIILHVPCKVCGDSEEILCNACGGSKGTQEKLSLSRLQEMFRDPASIVMGPGPVRMPMLLAIEKPDATMTQMLERIPGLGAIRKATPEESRQADISSAGIDPPLITSEYSSDSVSHLVAPDLPAPGQISTANGTYDHPLYMVIVRPTSIELYLVRLARFTPNGLVALVRHVVAHAQQIGNADYEFDHEYRWRSFSSDLFNDPSKAHVHVFEELPHARNYITALMEQQLDIVRNPVARRSLTRLSDYFQRILKTDPALDTVEHAQDMENTILPWQLYVLHDDPSRPELFSCTRLEGSSRPEGRVYRVQRIFSVFNAEMEPALDNRAEDKPIDAMLGENRKVFLTLWAVEKYLTGGGHISELEEHMVSVVFERIRDAKNEKVWPVQRLITRGILLDPRTCPKELHVLTFDPDGIRISGYHNVAPGKSSSELDCELAGRLFIPSRHPLLDIGEPMNENPLSVGQRVQMPVDSFMPPRCHSVSRTGADAIDTLAYLLSAYADTLGEVQEKLRGMRKNRG